MRGHNNSKIEIVSNDLKRLLNECKAYMEILQKRAYRARTAITNIPYEGQDTEMLVAMDELNEVLQVDITALALKKIENCHTRVCEIIPAVDADNIFSKQELETTTGQAKEIVCEMNKILERAEGKSKKEYIVGHYRNNVIKINICDILYVENAKRGSKITVCSDCEAEKFEGQILIDDKLDELLDKFYEFAFAHSSYIINVDHIEKIVGNEAFLDNGERLSVSRTYQKDLRENFIKHYNENAN